MLRTMDGLKSTRMQLLDQLGFIPDRPFEHSRTAPQPMLGVGIAPADAAQPRIPSDRLRQSVFAVTGGPVINLQAINQPDQALIRSLLHRQGGLGSSPAAMNVFEGLAVGVGGEHERSIVSATRRKVSA
jgi:hypothetical protein